MQWLKAEASLRGKLRINAKLADFTSWRVGGPADLLYVPADIKDLSQFLNNLPTHIPITWLGLGSNVLIRDGGIAGAVIITQGALKNINKVNERILRAEAGAAATQLARFTARWALQGLEFMAGIPGTVGGALAMNAGCFGGEAWQWVEAVETIDRQGEIRTRPATDFNVSYRHVIRPNNESFVAGVFKLTPGDKETALTNIKSLLATRNASQPAGTANCGSVFRNPYPLYAGQLIEQCGLKGKRIGGAVVSSKHANFIINDNHATAADIENLIAEIKNTIAQKTGVNLQTEVHILGRQ